MQEETATTGEQESKRDFDGELFEVVINQFRMVLVEE